MIAAAVTLLVVGLIVALWYTDPDVNPPNSSYDCSSL